MADEHNEEEDVELKRYTWDGTSPLERDKDRDGWRLRRMEALKEVIKGPAPPEDWMRAKEEYFDLSRGNSYDDEEWSWGR